MMILKDTCFMNNFSQLADLLLAIQVVQSYGVHLVEIIIL